MRLALSYAGVPMPTIDHVRRYGGYLPSQDEIVQKVKGGGKEARP